MLLRRVRERKVKDEIWYAFRTIERYGSGCRHGGERSKWLGALGGKQ